MASGSIKPWKLTEEETISTFTEWKVTILTAINQNDKYRNFADQTHRDGEWKSVDSFSVSRGLTDDKSTDGTVTRSAAVKAQDLVLMLEWVGSKAPHYLFSDIVRETESLQTVWTIIRAYYGLVTSEVDFLKGADIVWEDGERPERFYRRLRANSMDNLLKVGGLYHNGKQVTSDEKLSAMTERHIVRDWLKGLHPRLPALVCRQFATELQTKSLKDLQPAMSNGMDSLLEELRAEEARSHFVLSQDMEDLSIHKATGMSWGKSQYKTNYRTPRPNTSNRSQTGSQPQRSGSRTRAPPGQFCKGCYKASRPYTHPPLTCDYICEADKRTLRTFTVQADQSDELPVSENDVPEDK